jgi:hypothetical protein
VSIISLFKTKTPRDKKYKEWISSLSCCVCGYPPPSDPHHSESGGKGIKGSDYSCLPMCHTHHTLIHAKGKDTFCKEHDLDLIETTTGLNKIYKEKKAC